MPFKWLLGEPENGEPENREGLASTSAKRRGNFGRLIHDTKF